MADVATGTLQLRYDVVIHRVRSHRAGVALVQAGGDVVPVGTAAYDFVLKAVPAMMIAVGN